MPDIIAPPPATLGTKPTVQNEHDCNLALRELGWMASVRKSAQAECDAVIAQAQDAMQERLAGFGDRSKALMAAVEGYCVDHRAELLKPKAKNHKFTHGKIGWRSSREGVGYAEKQDKNSVLALIEERCGLMARMLKFLKTVFIAGTGRHAKTVDVILTLKPSIELKRIEQAIKDGEITDEELTEFGFVWVKSTESFFIEPNDYNTAELERIT